MKNFTGSIKKTIAGILSVACILFFSASYASDSTAVTGGALADRTVAVDNTAPTASVTNAHALQNSSQTATAAKPLTPAQVKPNSASQLASLVGGLALILVLIYGLSWFVKRFSQGGFLQNPTMKIVSAMPLGTRERLMLVEVGGKQLLLGVTATQINTLHVFDEPVVPNGKDQPVASDFSQKLMSILQQKNMSASGISSADESLDKKSNS